jgi:hypothetical protein
MFTIVCHGLAMVSMVLFLLPGIPGGSSDLSHRVSYIAHHPIQWRMGWLPWQLTAASDLLLSIAFVRTTWISRKAAWTSLVFTAIAVFIEQPAEWRWTTSGIDLAFAGEPERYRVFESEVFRQTSFWAALFYTLAAIMWSFALAKSGIWNRAMTWLSVVLWSLLIAISVGSMSITIDPKLVSVGNALGFTLMMLWFLASTELVMRRTRSTPTLLQSLLAKLSR